MSDTFNHEADAWDSLLFNEECEYPEGFIPHEKTCRHCGKSGLTWVMHDGKWRLAEQPNGLHVCFPNFRVKIKNAAQ